MSQINRTNNLTMEYPKTENLFTRNPDTHKLNLGDFRMPEFGLIKGWHVTEKIDGINMRVVYDPFYKTVEIRGRTDRAQIPSGLEKIMLDMFPLENMQAQFDEYLGDQIELGTTVTIYGEGYGAGIQKGGIYRPDKSFRVFDICYHRYNGLNSWCQMETTRMICRELKVPQAPMIALFYEIPTIVGIVDDMKRGQELSDTARQDQGNGAVVIPEGVVCRTDPYLYNELGKRIMFKLKVKDLP